MVSKWIFLSQKYCVYVIQPSNKKKALEKEKLNKSLVKNWKHMFTYPGRKKGWNFHDCCHYHQISADTPHASEFYRKTIFCVGILKVLKLLKVLKISHVLKLLHSLTNTQKEKSVGIFMIAVIIIKYQLTPPMHQSSTEKQFFV